MSEISSNRDFNNLKLQEISKKPIEKNSEEVKGPPKENSNLKEGIKELKSEDKKEITSHKEGKIGTIKKIDFCDHEDHTSHKTINKLKNFENHIGKNKFEDGDLKKLSPGDKQKIIDGIKKHKGVDKDTYLCKVKIEKDILKPDKHEKSEHYNCVARPDDKHTIYKCTAKPDDKGTIYNCTAKIDSAKIFNILDKQDDIKD